VLRSNSAQVPVLQRAEKAEPYRQQILELLPWADAGLRKVYRRGGSCGSLENGLRRKSTTRAAKFTFSGTRKSAFTLGALRGRGSRPSRHFSASESASLNAASRAGEGLP